MIFLASSNNRERPDEWPFDFACFKCRKRDPDKHLPTERYLYPLKNFPSELIDRSGLWRIQFVAKIVGAEPLPRSEVTKKLWAYIKKKKLQNPSNKREILADATLEPIFGEKKMDMFQMTKAVNKHLK